MNRDDLANLIKWQWIITAIGILNVSAMIPQLFQLVKNWNANSLALEMFMIYLVVQVGLGLDAFFKRNLPVCICMAISGLISITIIIIVLIIRAA